MRWKLGIGDTHFCFQSKYAISQVLDVVEDRNKLTTELRCGLDIFQVGDLYDCLSQSSFSRPHNFHMSAQQELDESEAAAREFWQAVRRRAPKARCYQILGNHCIRPRAFVAKRAPEALPLIEKKFKEIFTFPGVETIFDPRERLIVDDIWITHGHMNKLGDHVKAINGRHDVIHGHTHRAGVFWYATNNIQPQADLRFELDVGFLGDPWEKVCFHFTKTTWTTWTITLGEVDNNRVPRVIPLKQRRALARS